MPTSVQSGTTKHPHPDWAIAHVMVGWRRQIGPMLRKAEKLEVGSDEQRELCAEASKWIAGYARALESVS